MWKGVYFTQSEHFTEFEFENAVLFSPRDQSEMAADEHAFENNVWVPTPFHAFSEFITYQIAMENDETKYKSRDNWLSRLTGTDRNGL